MNNLMILESIDNSVVVQTLQKIAQFQQIVKSTLKSGQDYDTIPGTNKPTLLKPGAEKIGMLFGVNPEYDFLEKIEDYNNDFFAYDIRCTLFKNGQPVSQGVGSCNSKEKKYRWVNVKESEIPSHIDKSTLAQTTDSYGRTKYKMENDDVCSLVNTILKMAKKRAFIDATLQLAALSEIFTQDVEDMKDLIQKEQSENMTVEEASNMVLNFGKNKGKRLGEIFKSDNQYVKWYMENGRDEIVKKAFTILSEAVKNIKTKENEASGTTPPNTVPEPITQNSSETDEDTPEFLKGL